MKMCVCGWVGGGVQIAVCKAFNFVSLLFTGTVENEKTPISNKSDADFDVVGQEEGSDTENTITSEKKRPVGRKVQRRQEGSVLEDDEQEERPILPPATTRPSRKSKKLGEMTTGESGLLAPEGAINEDSEVVSTTNTPLSSASSSRLLVINREIANILAYQFVIYMQNQNSV